MQVHRQARQPQQVQARQQVHQPQRAQAHRQARQPQQVQARQQVHPHQQAQVHPLQQVQAPQQVHLLLQVRECQKACHLIA